MIPGLTKGRKLFVKRNKSKQIFRGEVDKYGWVDIGSSFLPSDIIAAFLYAQLEKLK
jgi:dTDP-4-amino-4,6-dideoxygalactose transaminase